MTDIDHMNSAPTTKLERCNVVQEASTPIKPLQLDPEKYRSYLEEFDMSQEQQDEMLATLWHIMRTMVDIGFGLDSVQNIFSGIVENTMQDEASAVKEKDHFNQSANPEGDNHNEKRHNG